MPHHQEKGLCWKCGREHTDEPMLKVDRQLSEVDQYRLKAAAKYLDEHHMKGAQDIHGKPNPDRHRDDTKVVAVRMDRHTYDRITELIANSVVNHSTVSGYLNWLVTTQALRKR